MRLSAAEVLKGLRGPAVTALAVLFVGAGGLMVSACGPAETAGTDGNGQVITSTAASTAATAMSAASDASASSSSTAVSSSEIGAVLFDDSKVHEISVTFAQADYDAMIAAYKSDGAKEWITASVTIDGKTYENVGMRLKGNSSLRGLANGRGGGPGGTVSAADPQGLPWLIRLDKNVDGQNHDGITDLVVRSNNSQTSLNEAVALQLLAEAGLASQRAIAIEFTVNGSATKLRLAMELPDDIWMEQHFLASGALYKAEASGDYSYRGTDPDAYDNVFDQEAGKDNTDLTPLIQFLDFVNNSDDATFNSSLPDLLDIDAFATYLAVQELINNFDDIDGPGNNSYLYWDATTGKFTVVPWDHNLAFGGMGGNRPGGAPPGGAPAGNAPGADDQARGPRAKTNLLVQRFHANAEFEALYQEKLEQLKTDLYESGAASAILAEWVDVLKTQASDLVDATTVDTEAARIAAYFEAR